MALKLYSVSPGGALEWHVVVAAGSARAAKHLGWREMEPFADYTDVRARLVRDVVVPDDVTAPRCWDTCAGAWMCPAWRYHPDLCDNCCNRPAKQAEEGEEDEMADDTTPTLSELRAAVANAHTAALPAVSAERYERDLRTALAMVDSLIETLVGLPHCPPGCLILYCNVRECRTCWEEFADRATRQR